MFEYNLHSTIGTSCEEIEKEGDKYGMEIYIMLRTNHEAEGVLQKFEKMARLLALGREEGNVDDVVASMLAKIDSKEGEKE